VEAGVSGSRTRIRNGDLGRNSATCRVDITPSLSETSTSAVVSAVPGSDTDLTSARQPQQWRRCAWILLPSLHITCSFKKTLPSSFFFARKPRIKRIVINFIFAQRTLLFSQVCHSNCCTMLFFLKKPSFEHCSCLELMDCRVSIPACFASEYVGCEFLHTRLNS
jgi:hypothetical protein